MNRMYVTFYAQVEKSAMQQNARLMARQTERLNDELRKDTDEGMPDLFESNAEKSVPLVSEHIYDFVFGSFSKEIFGISLQSVT